MLKDYRNILYPFIAILIFLIPTISQYYICGGFDYDCGRELIVPAAINQGFIPIKDIFLTYFPFSYQINAFLFKIFGENLDVLRIFSIILSCISLVFIYFTSREFTDEKTSLAATLIVPLICFFNVSRIYNYIFPYSFAFSYGVCLLFISLFFSIKFIKEDKFLYPAFFIFGLCLAMKAEFIFLVVPYIFILIYKKTHIKKALIALALMFLPLILSFLVIKGFNPIEYFDFIKAFMSSSILKKYNSQLLAFDFMTFFRSICEFLFLYFITFIVLYLPKKRNIKWLYYTLCVFLTLAVFVFAIIETDFCAGRIFFFINFVLLFILIKSIINNNLSFVFLSLVSILLTTRFNFSYTTTFLVYIMPVGLLTCYLFFNKKPFLTVFLIILSFVNLFYCVLSCTFCVHQVNTPKGNMLLPENYKADFNNEVLSFMNKIPDDKTVLILPDGSIFNFLSNKKTNLKYYQLIPNHIEVLGEDSIIEGLKSDMPDYILILNTNFDIYGYSHFCEDFGQKICKFTNENYNLVQKIGENKVLKADIFQR